jgi:hypothetical protein
MLSQPLTELQSSDEVAAAFDKVGQQGAAIPATAGKLVSLTGQALKEAAGNKVYHYIIQQHYCYCCCY